MSIRPTQASIFDLVRHGISSNYAALLEAQEQLSSGKRILRPSDDAIGTMRSLSLRRQSSVVEGYLSAIQAARPVMQTAVSEVEEMSGLYTEARALVLQAMNGTLNQGDRNSLAGELELLRASMLEVANARFGEQYLFGGTETGVAPYSETVVLGETRVVYHGDDHVRTAIIGRGTTVATTIPGSQLFGVHTPGGTQYQGLTGVASGTSADSGTGYGTLTLRHDVTTGALGAGLAFALGGASDTILGDHALVIDAAAGTVQLGDGPVRSIPGPGDADRADFRLVDAGGGELHLDFTGYTGATFTGTVRGDGSIAFDGSSFVGLTLAETDLELTSPTTGAVVHVDTTGITRAGTELVTFPGTTNVFDTLAGIAADLRSGEELGVPAMLDRVTIRMGELERHRENLLQGIAQLGATLARLDTTESGLENVGLHLAALISETEDADISEVVLKLTRAEQTLQIAQATGARLIQQSLLNFLR